jgi:hypothetical protein
MPRNSILVIWTLLVISSFSPSRVRAAEPVSAAEAMDLLEGSVNGIKSFDVKLEVVKRTFIVREDSPKDKKEQIAKLVAAPQVSREKYRQAFRPGKGRVDLLSGTEGMTSPPHQLVFDQESAKLWRRDSRRADITAATFLTPGPFGTYYRESYATLVGSRSLLACLRQRQNVKLSMSDGKVVLDASPEPGSNIHYPTWGIKVTVDPRYGFLPAIVEVTNQRLKGDEPALAFRREVTRWKMASGVWVPTGLKCTTFGDDPRRAGFFKEVLNEIEMTVDEENSSWNKEIPEDVFELRLPIGTQVVDAQRGVAYVTGSPGKNLDELAANARNLVHLGSAAQPAPPPFLTKTRLLLAIGAAFGIVILAALFVYRRKSTKGQVSP